jgi:hypothetical protein
MFSKSCTANSVRGNAASAKPAGFQTSQAAPPIRMKSVVQTGPKIQSGGFQDGFSIVRYQPSISGVVAMAPRAAPPRQIAMNTTRPIQRVRSDNSFSLLIALLNQLELLGVQFAELLGKVPAASGWREGVQLRLIEIEHAGSSHVEIPGLLGCWFRAS